MGSRNCAGAQAPPFHLGGRFILSGVCFIWSRLAKGSVSPRLASGFRNGTCTKRGMGTSPFPLTIQYGTTPCPKSSKGLWTRLTDKAGQKPRGLVPGSKTAGLSCVPADRLDSVASASGTTDASHQISHLFAGTDLAISRLQNSKQGLTSGVSQHITHVMCI